MPPCLVGMEACVGAHHLSRWLKALGHDARLMPAKYVRPYSKGQKNDFRDAETVQRPTMKFVATKTADQLDLQAMHRVRERLVNQRTGIINQIRAFLLERGVAVRQDNASCVTSYRASLRVSCWHETDLAGRPDDVCCCEGFRTLPFRRISALRRGDAGRGRSAAGRKIIFVCQGEHSLELSGWLFAFQSLTGAFRWVSRPN
jgi:hypothetical protein